ncbi:MAG: hypothetical protein CMP06_12910 [Xanthomonadales bacterium]|nr:hypothetical protein [Xanthomonadales bacterium]
MYGIFRDTTAKFGYCTVGMRLPTLMADVVGGQIGVEIVRVLQLDVEPNVDFTQTGERLVFGEEDVGT